MLDYFSGSDRGSEQGSTILLETKDGRVQFIGQGNERFALVKVPADFPVRYPLRETTFAKPAKAVLMDLDGTTVLSEHYWIDAIRVTVSRVLGDSSFRFSAADLPHVSGYSTRSIWPIARSNTVCLLPLMNLRLCTTLLWKNGWQNWLSLMELL